MSRKNRYNNGYVGVDVLDTSTPFSGMVNANKDYIYSLDTSSNLQGLTATPWTRPADWLSLPTISASEEKFTGLYAIFPGSCGGSGRSADSNFVAFSLGISGNNTNYIVNWGDGTPLQTYASGATAQYRYNFNDVSSTITTEGFKQVVIQAYPAVAGNTMHTVDLSRSYSEPGVVFRTGPIPSNWVDIRLAGNRITTFRTPSQNISDDTSVYITNTNPAWNQLRSFEWIGSAVLSSSNPNGFAKVFKNCTSLRNVVLPPDLTRDITSFRECFGLCTVLEQAPNLNTSSAVDMNGMFKFCFNLKTVPLYDTSKVTNMNGAFVFCGKLTTVPLFRTPLVSNFTSMFEGCSRLEQIPNFDYSSATLLDFTFSNCSSLKHVCFNNTSKVTSINSTFDECYNLIRIEGLNTEKCTTFSSAFRWCHSLRECPPLNASMCTSFASAFNKCYSLKNVSIVNTANVANFSFSFSDCVSLEACPVTDTGNATTVSYMFDGCVSLKSVPQLNFSKVTSGSYVFRNCTNLKEIPSLDFSSATDITSAFENCQSLHTVGNITLRSAGTNCNALFRGCGYLNTIPLTTTEFSKVNRMSNMFYGCESLSGYYTVDGSSTTQMDSMFYGCRSLLGITLINTSGVVNFASAFIDARSLRTVSYISWNHSSASSTATQYMFSGCESLTTIGGLTLNSSTSYSNTFNSCRSLVSVGNLGGITGTISFSGSMLSPRELDRIYHALLPAAVAGSRTITVTGNWGASASNRSIATAKNWTVTA